MENVTINEEGMFAFVDVSSLEAIPYNQLVIYKSCYAEILEIEQHLDADFSGGIVVDTLFHTGNNSNRFITGRVERGEFVHDSFEVLPVPRKHALRELSNGIIREDPEGMEAGVMNSAQKRLLKKGISI